jgi:hypothetical protein
VWRKLASRALTVPEDADSIPAPSWVGSTQPSLLAVGHSHAAALAAALRSGPNPFNAAVLVSARHVYGPAYWQEAAASARVPTAILFRGNEYNVHFLFEPDPPFRLVHPLEPQDATMPAVPIQAIREMMRDKATELDQLLERFNDRPIVFVEPPPPKQADEIRRWLPTEPFFVKMAQDVGWSVEEIPISRLSLRLAASAVVRELYAAVANARGVAIIGPPRAAIAHDGSLLPEYSRHDATHGNDSYGALVWRQIADHFGIEPEA